VRAPHVVAAGLWIERSDAQPLGEESKRSKRWFALAALDPAYECVADAGETFRKLPLRESLLLAQPLDPPAYGLPPRYRNHILRTRVRPMIRLPRAARCAPEDRVWVAPTAGARLNFW
jgi:hypothetical protein